MRQSRPSWRNICVHADGHCSRRGMDMQLANRSLIGTVAGLGNFAAPLLRNIRSRWGFALDGIARSYPGDEFVSNPTWLGDPFGRNRREHDERLAMDRSSRSGQGRYLRLRMAGKFGRLSTSEFHRHRGGLANSDNRRSFRVASKGASAHYRGDESGQMVCGRE